MVSISPLLWLHANHSWLIRGEILCLSDFREFSKEGLSLSFFLRSFVFFKGIIHRFFFNRIPREISFRSPWIWVQLEVFPCSSCFPFLIDSA